MVVDYRENYQTELLLPGFCGKSLTPNERDAPPGVNVEFGSFKCGCGVTVDFHAPRSGAHH